MEDSTKKNKSQLVSDFLVKNRKVIITVIVVLVVGLIGFTVVNSVIAQKEIKSIKAAAEFDELYRDVLSDETKEEELVKLADNIKEEHQGSIAELMVYSRMASYYFDNDNFDKALLNYTDAYTLFPNDLAASTYMFNAAMCLDELDRGVEAIAILEDLVEKYKSADVKVADLSGDVPEAIFNLGRLYEDNGNRDKAIENYEILVAEYQSYNLSNLAKSRLLKIK